VEKRMKSRDEVRSETVSVRDWSGFLDLGGLV